MTKDILFFLIFIIFWSCNTINIIHTQGTASDVIDDNDSPTVTTDLKVPVSVTGK